MFSPHVEELQSALFYDAVPDTWTNLAHIHPRTALPTGEYTTVTGFSCYAQSYSSDLKPAVLFPLFFCPKLVLMQISFTLK